MLRRLEKRIMVPLPDQPARRAILDRWLQGRCVPGVDLDQVAAQTEGYSGSDIYLLAKESAMRPLRRLMSQLEAVDLAAAAGTAVSAQQQQALANPEALLEEISMNDIQDSLRVTKPSVRLLEQYTKFSNELGQMGA